MSIVLAGALAAMMRAEREASTGPRKVSSISGGGGGVQQPYIPGLAQLQQAQQTSKNAAKNKYVEPCFWERKQPFVLCSPWNNEEFRGAWWRCIWVEAWATWIFISLILRQATDMNDLADVAGVRRTRRRPPRRRRRRTPPPAPTPPPLRLLHHHPLRKVSSFLEY